MTGDGIQFNPIHDGIQECTHEHCYDECITIIDINRLFLVHGSGFKFAALARKVSPA